MGYFGDKGDFGLVFSYADDEGLIYEFVFPWQSLDNATVEGNTIKMSDDEGEEAEIQLFTLTEVKI